MTNPSDHLRNLSYRPHSPGSQPEYLSPDYRSSIGRAPSQPLVLLPHTLSELHGPVFGHAGLLATDHDLTAQHAGQPLGERILVHGRVLDEAGRPVPGALLEVWQANAAGRYLHKLDQHDAPIDPNFSGAGRVLTGSDGTYQFQTIKPGAYPWGNHYNAWRPAHIHFSLFGAGLLSRLVTQMYFPGDPCTSSTPSSTASRTKPRAPVSSPPSISIARSLPTPSATALTLSCAVAMTPSLRPADMTDTLLPLTPECAGSQTVGPYYAIGLDHLVSESLAGPHAQGRHLTISGTVFDADGQPVPDAIVELWQADSNGQYHEPQALGESRSYEGFLGFARLSTHAGGSFHVATVQPGSVPFPDRRPQAPHLVALVFMRGLMRHLVTRIYFPGHPLNASDPILHLVPPERRKTLVAQPADASGDSLRWDIRLQGPQETVFFSC